MTQISTAIRLLKESCFFIGAHSGIFFFYCIVFFILDCAQLLLKYGTQNSLLKAVCVQALVLLTFIVLVACIRSIYQLIRRKRTVLIEDFQYALSKFFTIAGFFFLVIILFFILSIISYCVLFKFTGAPLGVSFTDFGNALEYIKQHPQAVQESALMTAAAHFQKALEILGQIAMFLYSVLFIYFLPAVAIGQYRLWSGLKHNFVVLQRNFISVVAGFSLLFLICWCLDRLIALIPLETVILGELTVIRLLQSLQCVITITILLSVFSAIAYLHAQKELPKSFQE